MPLLVLIFLVVGYRAEAVSNKHKLAIAAAVFFGGVFVFDRQVKSAKAAGSTVDVSAVTLLDAFAYAAAWVIVAFCVGLLIGRWKRNRGL